jgi:hypothetical protein
MGCYAFFVPCINDVYHTGYRVHQNEYFFHIYRLVFAIFPSKSILNIFFTGAAIFSILYTMLYEDFNLADAVAPTKRILMIFPFFAFSDAINNIHLLNIVNRVTQKN